MSKNSTVPPGLRRGVGPVSRTVACRVTGLPVIQGLANDLGTTVDVRVPLAKMLTDVEPVLWS